MKPDKSSQRCLGHVDVLVRNDPGTCVLLGVAQHPRLILDTGVWTAVLSAIQQQRGATVDNLHKNHLVKLERAWYWLPQCWQVLEHQHGQVFDQDEHRYNCVSAWDKWRFQDDDTPDEHPAQKGDQRIVNYWSAWNLSRFVDKEDTAKKILTQPLVSEFLSTLEPWHNQLIPCIPCGEIRKKLQKQDSRSNEATRAFLGNLENAGDDILVTTLAFLYLRWWPKLPTQFIPDATATRISHRRALGW